MTADKILQRTAMAARLMAAAGPARKASALRLAAARIRGQAEELETAARLDDRRFSADTAAALADGILKLADKPDPVGSVLSGGRRTDGQTVSAVRVPLGAVGVLDGGDPAAVIRFAALLTAGGNTALFGAEPQRNRAASLAVELFRRALLEAGLPADGVAALSGTDAAWLLTSPVLRRLVVCPGASLTAKAVGGCVPPCLVLTDPVTHLYAAPDAEPAEIAELAVAAAVSPMPLHTLLLHREAINAVLPPLLECARAAGLRLCGDETLCRMPGFSPADNWRTPAPGSLFVRTVDSQNEALARIQLCGSGHLAGIVTRDLRAAQRFAAGADTAAVTVNTVPTWRAEDVLSPGLAAGTVRGPITVETFMTEKQLLSGSGQAF